MANTSFLALWLEAPLQSWGASAKFYRRSTLSFPTKSGILGMILCGIGATGKQHFMLQNFVDLDQTVLSYKKKNLLNQSIPVLEDFQVIGAGYDSNHKWESLHIPKTSTGAKPSSGGSRLSYKYYLQNAYFGVIVEIPDNLKLTIERALTMPYYGIYLGRKNCIPTDFVYRGIYSSKNLAEKKLEDIAEQKELLKEFTVLDGVHDGEIVNIQDVPTQFGLEKKYVERQVTIIRS